MPDNPNTAEPWKPRSRWFQFRLRTLLVGMALLAIPCGYVGWQAKIVREREAAESREEKLGWRFAIGSMPPLSEPTAVILPVGATQDDVKRTALEFPEMQIVRSYESHFKLGSQHPNPKIIFSPPP
jgi:hypothetical protein